jgi:hypothetical protein
LAGSWRAIWTTIGTRPCITHRVARFEQDCLRVDQIVHSCLAAFHTIRAIFFPDAVQMSRLQSAGRWATIGG